jgi:hypothetical protein
VLSTHALRTHCSRCFMSPREVAVKRKGNEESLKRCGACRIMHYCSSVRKCLHSLCMMDAADWQACQVADWPSHKLECAALKKLRERYSQSHTGPAGTSFVPHESVRAIGRLFWDSKRSRDEGRPTTAVRLPLPL